MVVKLNPAVISDDMMYEGGIAPMEPFAPNAEIDAWAKEYEREHQTTVARVKEDKLWGEIRQAAKTNKTLQSALEECIIIYKLSKEYTNGT
jgi:hypothetical protein